jgi:hypothetical protein
MGGDEPPANGPEWRTCRRDIAGTSPAPLDAFERALMNTGGAAPLRPVAEATAVRPDRAGCNKPDPTTPPPRVFFF